MYSSVRRWVWSWFVVGAVLLSPAALATQPVTAGCLDFLEVDGQVFVRVGFESTEPLAQTNIFEQVGLEMSTYLLPLEETAANVYTAWMSAFPTAGGEGIFQIADVMTVSGSTQNGIDLGGALAIYPDAPECALAATARVPGTEAASVTTVATTATTVPATITTIPTTVTTAATTTSGSSGGKGFPLVPVALVAIGGAAVGAVLIQRRGQLRASDATISKTGIPLTDFIDASDTGMQWTADNIADLGPALEAASNAVGNLHERFPSAVADAYGSGTMTNIEDTVKFFGGGDLERGCLSHQRITFEAVKGLLQGSSLEVSKVRIGTVFEHNAVVVYPRGKDWKQSGIVLDGWIRQKSALDKMVYRFPDWVSFGDRPRLLGD